MRLVIVSLCLALAAPAVSDAAPWGRAPGRVEAPRSRSKLVKRWAKRLAVGLVAASVLGNQALAGARPPVLSMPAEGQAMVVEHLHDKIAWGPSAHLDVLQPAQPIQWTPIKLKVDAMSPPSTKPNVAALLGVDANEFASAMTRLTGLSSPLDASKQQAPISSLFGTRYHPVHKIWRMHDGFDFAVYKAKLYAPAEGKVVFAGWKGGYGRTVIVEDANGTQFLFGHLAKIQVKKGQPVKSGQRVGISGNSGVGTGYHLHFEVRKDGQAVDTLPYLRAAGGFAEWYQAGAAPDFEMDAQPFSPLEYF